MKQWLNRNAVSFQLQQSNPFPIGGHVAEESNQNSANNAELHHIHIWQRIMPEAMYYTLLTGT